jgi:hypothetical protein
MADVPYHPDQEIEQPCLEVDERATLEDRLAQATPATDDTPSVPEQSEQQQLQSAISDRTYAPTAEAQGKVASAVDAVPEISDVYDVRISQINSPEINSPEDFRTGSYEGLRQDLERLQELKPHIEAGHGEQTADAWDQQRRLGHYAEQGYVRGYTDAYETYYRADPVALSINEDGRYEILDGRHRVYLAREIGLETMPARVV